MFTYFWERDRMLAGRGRERGRHRSRLQFWAVSTEPDAELELTIHEIMTKATCFTDWATQGCPLNTSFLITFTSVIQSTIVIRQEHSLKKNEFVLFCFVLFLLQTLKHHTCFIKFILIATFWGNYSRNCTFHFIIGSTITWSEKKIESKE